MQPLLQNNNPPFERRRDIVLGVVVAAVAVFVGVLWASTLSLDGTLVVHQYAAEVCPKETPHVTTCQLRFKAEHTVQHQVLNWTNLHDIPWGGLASLPVLFEVKASLHWVAGASQYDKANCDATLSRTLLNGYTGYGVVRNAMMAFDVLGYATGLVGFVPRLRVGASQWRAEIDTSGPIAVHSEMNCGGKFYTVSVEAQQPNATEKCSKLEAHVPGWAFLARGGDNATAQDSHICATLWVGTVAKLLNVGSNQTFLPFADISDALDQKMMEQLAQEYPDEPHFLVRSTTAFSTWDAIVASLPLAIVLPQIMWKLFREGPGCCRATCGECCRAYGVRL